MVIPALDGIYEYLSSSGNKKDTEVLGYLKMAELRKYAVGNWNGWSLCSNICLTGYQIRTRFCLGNGAIVSADLCYG